MLKGLIGTRMLDWIVLALVLVAVVTVVAPQNLAVMAYKLALVSLFAVLGYWLDRRMFPLARPHIFLNQPSQQMLAAAAMLRRSVIILAVILGGTLGL